MGKGDLHHRDSPEQRPPLDRDPLDRDPPCGQTNASENITFPQLRLRAVIKVENVVRSLCEKLE